jgi:A/G-specific adenine glycosylase
VNPATLPASSICLLDWWDRHGRKNLPWQHPRSPYPVWVSEIMLQQTQVQTVIPYFERFIKRFPDLPTLAKAPLDDVLALWAGLGYYARGRNLHRAAGVCMEQHAGELPGTAAQLAALPGIGDSTANAIWSQAWDQPAPVLDGNVRRVLSRHAAIEGWSGEKRVLEHLMRAANDRLPKDRGADYTQAIMDLGSLVCVRSKPACAHCPVAGDCIAFADQRTGELPSKRPKISVREVQLEVLLAFDPEGRVLLERRPAKGIWGGLWSLPEADNAIGICTSLGLLPESGTALPELEHRLTHRLLKIRPTLFLDVDSTATLDSANESDWFNPAQFAQLGLPRPMADLLNSLIQD